jgi:hypothetical protein
MLNDKNIKIISITIFMSFPSYILLTATKSPALDASGAFGMLEIYTIILYKSYFLNELHYPLSPDKNKSQMKVD